MNRIFRLGTLALLALGIGGASPPAVQRTSSPPPLPQDAPARTVPPGECGLPEQADADLCDRRLRRRRPGETDGLPASSNTLMSVWVDARTRDGRDVRVGNGGTLYTSEQLVFHVMLHAPAFVQVIQVMPDGTPEVLYPEPGDPSAQPGVDLRLPPAPSTFEVEGPPGTERILVIATRRPLKEADKKVATLIKKAQAGEKLSLPAPRKTETPSNLVTLDRGNSTVRSERSQVLDTIPDAQGIAIVVFQFQHLE